MASETHEEEEHFPSFPSKLFHMVENDKYNGIIWWTENGDGFFICKEREFVKSDILDKYKVKSYGSFTRQLGKYGFHKKRRPTQERANGPSSYYCHDEGYFKRGCKHLLVKIINKENQGTKKVTSTKVEPEQMLNLRGIHKDLSQETETPPSFENDRNEAWHCNPAASFASTTTSTFPNGDAARRIVADGGAPSVSCIGQSSVTQGGQMQFSGECTTTQITVPESEDYQSIREAVSASGGYNPDYQYDPMDAFNLYHLKGLDFFDMDKESPFDLKDVWGVLPEDLTNSDQLFSHQSTTTEVTPQFPITTPDASGGETDRGYSSSGSSFQGQIDQEVAAFSIHGNRNSCEIPALAATASKKPATDNLVHEGNSSQEQEVHFKAKLKVDPSCGPVEGGQAFFLKSDKPLPETAWARFGDSDAVGIGKTAIHRDKLFGTTPRGKPGPVPVQIFNINGVCLGVDIYTYEPEPKEKRKKERVPSKKRKHEEIKDLIRKTIQDSLKQSRRESSKEPNETMDSQQGHPDVIDWLALSKALEEIEFDQSETSSDTDDSKQICEDVLQTGYCDNCSEGEISLWKELSSDKDFKQILEDDITETGYSADGETSSSSSEKGILDSDDELNKTGAWRASNLPSLELSPNHKMSESDIHNYALPYGIGIKWKDLARALGYLESCINAIEEEKCHCPKECCIEVLVLWMNREGDEATAARLADALRRIGLKNLADILIYPIDPSHINASEKEIREMKRQLISLKAKGSILSSRIKELEEENLQLRATVEFKGKHEQGISQVSKMGNKPHEELEEQLSIARQTLHKREEEVNRLPKTAVSDPTGSKSRGGKKNQQLRATVEFKDRGEREQEMSQVEQVFRMVNKSEELEEQLLISRQTSQEKEEEILRLRKEIDELKEELSNVKRESDDTRQEDGAFFSDADQADKEHRIRAQLKNINEQLKTYVTSPLQAPSVKQDQLRLAVRLDLLIRLSENLQELYTETQGMISEAAKCSEDLRRDYYDLAYHGLRAEHFELVHKVEDLESAQEDMSEEERKEYERLQSYQNDRQRRVEALDKVWRHLFSPVNRLPKKALSDPTGSKSRGGKKVLRLTDPSYLLKKLKLREETYSGAEAPSTSNDKKPDEDSHLMRKKRSSVGRAILSRKEKGGEKQSSGVSWNLMRDG